MFLKISEYSQENACVKSLFNKVAILKISCFIKIDSNTVFFCKYREIFRARLLQNNSGGSFWMFERAINTPTAQKIKFSIKDFFSKCDQICSFLRIWTHLLTKSIMENFIFVQCPLVFATICNSKKSIRGETHI